MDRYVIRERRVGEEYPEGNQMIAFSTTSTGNNITMPENIYYRAYNTDAPNLGMHHLGIPALVPLQQQSYLPNVMQIQAQSQMMSGIDSRYLASYTDKNAGYIATGQLHSEPKPFAVNAFGSDYQNRNFIGAERIENKRYVPQRIPNAPPVPVQTTTTLKSRNNSMEKSRNNLMENQQLQIQHKPFVVDTSKKQVEIDISKNEIQNKVKTRAEKLKDLHKCGTRVFSGPVENILKWHKSLQNIGIMAIYEIVGKCVSVTTGDSCAKNLVVRDDNGPAIQVVYYEIDYLLPELKTPCTVRVIGRIMPGTSRLQAFNVRPATGDDVAALPRRAAVAAHHVAKLCNEYNN